MPKADPLEQYKAKRNFDITSEPAAGGRPNARMPAFVIQKHWARRLHYDFRLELDGTMKSWAVPKGPSLDPSDKRMAVHVEDHPISYNRFEGEIPAGQYGAGKVIIWDKGVWSPVGDPRQGYAKGKLEFELHGHKLAGRWVLLRMRGKDEQKDPWLLIKEKDEAARPASEYSIVDERPESVAARPAATAATPVGAMPSQTTLLETAPQAELPDSLKPELATLVDEPPQRAEDWIFEIKFDGYRLLARREGRKLQLITRNGHDWTDRLRPLQQAMLEMPLPDGWYDGEIVVLDNQGVPNFQALQGAFDAANPKDIIYYLFDLPYCDGRDLRRLPLVTRRVLLEQLLSGATSSSKTQRGRKAGGRAREHTSLETGAGSGNGPIRFSAAFDASAGDIYASACQLGLEGIIGKRRASHYVSRRSGDWIKLKCSLRQEFVIGGYTDPKGTRNGIGSLLLGVHDDHGVLKYAGKVGSGFDAAMLDDIKRQLQALETTSRPFDQPTGEDRKAHWVRPVLLAEVSFAQWTRDNHIRHAVFHGLRSDKPPRAITRETSMQVKERKPASGSRRRQQENATTQPAPLGHALPDNIKVTHPERIVDPDSGTTKLDVVRYYALVGPLMLEHLKGRPVSLVRAPEGVGKQMFFQKHLETTRMAGVRALPGHLDPGHEPLLEVATTQGLLSAAQMNVIEFHTWNAVKSLIGKPDRITFDLDPGKGVPWEAMQEAALVLRAFLQELELTSFVKTSGGKGLHVVVPIQRRYDWDTAKGFSQAIVQHLASTLPGRFSAKSGPRNRVGKIFIDYLRNGFGATTVAAWSLRARPGMGVSVPLSWNEVEKLESSAQWHIRNIRQRLDIGNSPWQDYATAAQTLTQAMKILPATDGAAQRRKR